LIKAFINFECWLQKRAANVAACKQRDYQRKLERLQHEESLIGGH